MPKPEVTLGPWSVIGPFAPSAFDTAFEPERGVDLAATYRDGALAWHERPEWVDGGGYGFPGGNSETWYLTRTLTAPSQQDLLLSIGSDDGFALWLDGAWQASRNICRGLEADQDRVSLRVSPGEHRLLLKIFNVEANSGFYFRVLGSDGAPFVRGGVTGMAAILVQTSQSTRTAPVRRGVWFLENLLGTPPPPPPPKAKDGLAKVEADSVEAHLSRRRILEKHRTDPVCASCHARFDPLGFALENFGPDGLWRGNEQEAVYNQGRFVQVVGGPPIDASGELADGRTFADIRSLKTLLSAQPRRFVRAFAKKLLAFAVARRLEPHDDASIDSIVEAAFAHDFRIRAVLAAVVASDSFRQH
jgi:hypothetical protein